MTYAGAYGGNERVPVDRVLRREGHPLGVRRAEATRIATEEPESPSSAKRWTLGVAAGALLVAGTFAAGALGLNHGSAPAGAPDHANAASGQGPNNSGPVVGAPVPGQDTQQQPQIPQQGRPTTPASAGAQPNAPVDQSAGTGTSSGTSTSQGGSASSQSVSGSDTSTTTPAPSTTTPAPAPAEQQQSSGGGVIGGVTDTVGDVLSPVTDVVGGILSPSSSTASTTSTTTPSGPALTMIDPLGDLLGN